ncbi:MAG: SLC13 family permease [Planctomycetota bacterium]
MDGHVCIVLAQAGQAAASVQATPGWEAWTLLGLIGLMLGALASGRFGVDIVMVGILALLLLLGIVGPTQAVSGFGNPALWTVALLYVVAGGLRETGAITALTTKLIGRPKSARGATARIAAPVAALSAFANNTPIVASFLPVIDTLSRRSGIPASKLYMPLSFAAILGGTCTLIGTSTTLVVHGQILEHNEDIKRQGGELLPVMGMFTIGAVGVPLTIIGAAYVLLLGDKLLPARGHAGLDAQNARQYQTAMRVEPGSPVVGKSVEAAGLRHLPGLFLSRIERADETIIGPEPEEALRGDDVLVFVGILDSVVDLQKIRGLVPLAHEERAAGEDEPRSMRRLVESVVSNSSPLIGRSIRDAGFRTRYGAVVVAVSRQGHTVPGKLGDIVLRPGDTLLMEVGVSFTKRFRQSRDFHLVSELDDAASPRHDRAWIATVILGGLVILISTEVLSPLVGAAAAAAGMVLTRCCTGPQARSSIDWTVVVVIGCAFGIGRAMESTGLANSVAGLLVDAAMPLGPIALLAAIYVVTLLFTMFITNNAAAVLMFPIALAASQEAGLGFMPFAIALAVAASAEFSTPIGYQTNLMVMGPGGYRWLDYTRFGLPLTVLGGVVTVIVAPIVFGF